MKGIEWYKQHVLELLSMLPYLLWEQGMWNGIKWPPLVGEEELQDYLCDNINQAQWAYLKQHNHNIYLWTYSERLMFLQRGEDNILLKQVTLKQQEVKEKEEYKKAKVSGKCKNGSNTNNKTKCKHCGNFHLGKCHLKDTANNLLKGDKGN